jgi:hypothetical protein
MHRSRHEISESDFAMARDTRRSGLSLVLAGFLAISFFLITDAGWGIMGRSADAVDAIHEATPGTYIGIAGGLVVVAFGFWLTARRGT